MLKSIFYLKFHESKCRKGFEKRSRPKPLFLFDPPFRTSLSIPLKNHIENQLFVARPYTTRRLYVVRNWQWKTYFHYSFNITRQAIITYENSANILPPPQHFTINVVFWAQNRRIRVKPHCSTHFDSFEKILYPKTSWNYPFTRHFQTLKLWKTTRPLTTMQWQNNVQVNKLQSICYGRTRRLKKIYF